MLEELCLIVERCGLSWTEAWDLPVPYRSWMLQRAEKRKKESERRPASDDTKPRKRPPGKSTRKPPGT
jgi:hypothetical protein